MTLIAACSLDDRIWVAADSRITWKTPQNTYDWSDDVLKVYPLGSHALIAFTGDVDTASGLILSLLVQREKKRFSNDLSMLYWAQRFLRYTYKRSSAQSNVAFLFAASIPGRLNTISRPRLQKLFNDELAAQRVHGGQLNFPPYIIEALTAKDDVLLLAETNENILCVMRSPDFSVQHIHPLESITIGSGRDARIEIEQVSSSIFLQPKFMAQQHFKGAIYEFIHARKLADDSVGGLIGLFEVGAKGAQFLPSGFRLMDNSDGAYITSVHGRLVQVNLKTKESLPLLAPWERSPSTPRKKFKYSATWPLL